MSLRGLAGLIVTSALATAWSAPVRACTCPTDILHVSWPPDGAVGVELDAPLVVLGFRVEEIDATLTAADGTVVPLVERNRLAPDDPECVSTTQMFLTPSAPLAPNTRYDLYVEDPHPRKEFLFGNMLVGRPKSGVSFVTGTRLRSAEMPEVRVSVYGVERSSTNRALELFIESDWPEPLFVQVQGQRHIQTRVLDPSSQPYYLPLGAVDCAEPLIVDVTGRVVLSESRCRPSKCAVLERPTALDTCGGEANGPFSWDDWQQIPNRCRGGSGDAPTDVVTSEKPAAGCHLTRSPASGSAFPAALGPAALCLLAGLWRRARRGTPPPAPL